MSKVTKVTYILIGALCLALCTVAMVAGLPSYANIEAHAESEEYINWTWKCTSIPLTYWVESYRATDSVIFARQFSSSGVYMATWYYEIVDCDNNVYTNGTYSFANGTNMVFYTTTNYGVNENFKSATATTEQTWEVYNTEGNVVEISFYNYTNNTTTIDYPITFNLSTPSTLDLNELKLRVCHSDQMTPAMREISANGDYPFFETKFTGFEGMEESELSAYIQDFSSSTTSTPKYPIKYSTETSYQTGYDTGYTQGYEEGQASLTETEQYQNGYDLGLIDGYKQGSESSYNAGYEAGSEEGYSVGYNQGETIGYNSGYAAGEEAGYDTGYQKGSYDVNLSLTEVTATGIGAFSDLLMQLLNFEVAGISLWGILATIGAVIVIGIIIKIAL